MRAGDRVAVHMHDGVADAKIDQIRLEAEN